LLIQTRGPLVVRDADVLKQFRRVRVNVSIPTDSEDVRQQFEPKAPPLDRRWQALNELRADGIPVGLCVTPMLPVADPDAFIARIVRFRPEVLVMQDFHDAGGRLSDHGLDYCHAEPCTEAEAAATFEAARSGRAATPQARSAFAAYLMLFFGRLDAEKGWTKQLHLGAHRNANSRALSAYGRDGGFDSIGDWPQAAALGAYLDRLEQEQALPKMIIYNVNPSDNYTFATMIGNFQDGSVPGKIQFGSGWWFLDQKEGIEWQLNALSNCGLLAPFVGMITDSRSFMSYPRHEYFRRVLCNMLGEEMENGELPSDEALVGGLVEDVSFRNASRYFGWG